MSFDNFIILGQERMEVKNGAFNSFFIVTVVATGGTSMAENLSTCSVETVPIQILNSWGDNPKTTLSAIDSPSGIPSFNTFVTTVTEHLAAKLDQEKLCLDSAESQDRSLVQFAHLYLSPPEDDHRLAAVRPLEALPSDVCRISSPWIDIAIERKPFPSVRAIARFSERQFLADQAVLEGALNVPPGIAIPLTGEEFIQYDKAYVKWEEDIHFGREHLDRPIEELVPIDILWILRRALPSRLPGATNIAMRKVVEQNAQSYTQVVTMLIDRCFTSGGEHLQIKSVHELNDEALFEEYTCDIPANSHSRANLNNDQGERS